MARQSSSAGRRSSVPALVLVGLGAFLITMALALVFFVVPAQKKTPLDINSTTVTDTVPGAVLVGSALASNTPTELNADRAECRAPEATADEGEGAGEGAEGEGAEGEGAEGAGEGETVETLDGPEADDSDVQFPVTCFIDNDIPMYSQRRVQAVEPSDAEVITMQAAQSLMREDKQGGDDVEALINATIDRVTLDRVSARPVDEPVSTLQLVSAGGSTDETAPVGFVRDGLQYKFPFDTEKTNYPYFDASTFTTNPIEFVGETTVGGIDAYEFRQELGPIDMWTSIRDHYASVSDGYDPTVESILASYRREGTAGQWGLEGDPERPVDMRRFYTNTRTVWVNPDTGQIIKGGESIFQFFAENQDEAEEFFNDKARVEQEKADPTRTAVRFDAGWNEETIDTTVAAAQDSADTLNTFGRIVPAILGILGLLSLIGGIVLGLRGGGRAARARA
ncbi:MULTISPECIES: DUF3068 domain-containing protein [Dietzia]|uniref:DUF3068 family protein n=1 Tax=Dietzia cinnamea TaxID=321318 RepID=A0A4V2W8B2_9ACTN|nr:MULTISPECIES: DUF3068 domain-containing protein [Dietzia]MBS7548126.1 DUF3068 domain-containing protein [Dietzia massiliensis]TCW25681.1 DUF3068 family protein [Dietzia cinnamea]